jgi:hypothetical protein
LAATLISAFLEAVFGFDFSEELRAWQKNYHMSPRV